MPEIGETLREARMRRRIDMAEVETATKIRAKYLRALESEEWELLPGPTFVKTFLRTYADYLELDSRLLVEEYKQRFERPAGMELTPLNLRRQPRRRRMAPRLGPGVVVVLGIVVVLGALYVLGSAGDDEEPTPAPRTETPAPSRDGGSGENGGARRRAARAAAAAPCERADRGDGHGLRVHGGRARAPGRRRGDAPGRPAHAHVPRHPLPRHVRQRERAHAGERPELPRGVQHAGGRLRPAPRARAAAAVERAADLLVTPRAGIVVTGTEVLSGIIADRNGPWLAERLRDARASTSRTC